MSDLVEILTENKAVLGLDYPIEIKIYRDGEQITPTSVTLTIKDPDGTVQVDETAITPNGNGTMSYDLAAASTAALWENAWMELSYTDEASKTQKQIFYFDVVNNRLGCAVITADLEKLHPQLLDEIWSGQSPANFSPQIQVARADVDRDLVDRGFRPDLLVDSRQTMELVRSKTLENVCRDFIKQENDRWHILWMVYKTEYEDRLVKFKFTYDKDEDTMVDEGDKESFGQLQLER